MKILVIDDTQVHLDAAIQQLGKEHDLTVCSSHDEALKELSTYDKNWNKKESYWDAVLCDLLMPAGKNAQGGEGLQYVGVEMSVGWSLALQAAQAGAKYVAVVTDMNHHHHPASAMLDHFNRHTFTIDGAKVLMTNYVGHTGIIGTECTCAKCGGAGKCSRGDGSKYDCVYCEGTGTDHRSKGKDWLGILNQLLNPEKEAE